MSHTLRVACTGGACSSDLIAHAFNYWRPGRRGAAETSRNRANRRVTRNTVSAGQGQFWPGQDLGCSTCQGWGRGFESRRPLSESTKNVQVSGPPGPLMRVWGADDFGFGPRMGRRLTDARPAVGAEEDRGLIATVDSRGERVHLLRGQEVPFLVVAIAGILMLANGDRTMRLSSTACANTVIW